MKYILFALALAAVGLAFAMAAVILARPCGPGCGAFVVLPVSGHMDDIELRIRKLVRESRGLPGAAIVIADLGADSETADICRMICRICLMLPVIVSRAKGIFVRTPSRSMSDRSLFR